jgi:hypothetical protein
LRRDRPPFAPDQVGTEVRCSPDAQHRACRRRLGVHLTPRFLSQHAIRSLKPSRPYGCHFARFLTIRERLIAHGVKPATARTRDGFVMKL